MATIKEQIVETGKNLAVLNPKSQALQNAREFYKNGCFSKYANHDLDVLHAMKNEIERIEKSSYPKRIENLTLDNTDCCPNHNVESANEYTFGMQDATVITYKCGCALSYKEDGFLGGWLFKNYNDAASHATLTKMQCQADNAPFK